MKIKYIFFLLLITLTFDTYADESLFTVSGEITYSKNHPVTVEIINKQEYDENLSSRYSLVIPVEKNTAKNGTVSFSITDIPPGKYIVKVYQDLNNNGKFDFALIGGEPLATYRKPGFTLGRPSFKKLAFLLNKNLSNIRIKL